MERTSQYMFLGHYSQDSIRNYLRELRYFFVHYGDVPVQQFCADHVVQYLLYLNKTLGCSRTKCHGAAQSISFFFRNVLQKPLVLPTLIYPRKATKLPPVMSQQEIKALIDTIQNVKHRTVVMLLYSTGMRLREISKLKITDIDSKAMQIKVVQGKGSKDRFTLLSQQVLLELRAYYLIYRPQEYLFNGAQKGRPLSLRSIQHLVKIALARLGLQSKRYSVHTIRHSFATHLVENGTDLHTVKELLGHSSLQTTSRYLHLSAKHRQSVVNPYDVLPGEEQPSGSKTKH
ncbi:site-specific integrase [Chitinophagaceae bacterium LB-8]|uniref:Site-specific integrase n=1 Tax=Paraflavisolibacter caeni TaxID=2982496 RepID=A0A9X3BKF4_9BACT|nr:tyrosine-type recombinase/integrase [Paraflavisolibacter caeni]MCU7552908.1 site-specific integrase [Paraflavisolibacter caeni]